MKSTNNTNNESREELLNKEDKIVDKVTKENKVAYKTK